MLSCITASCCGKRGSCSHPLLVLALLPALETLNSCPQGESVQHSNLVQTDSALNRQQEEWSHPKATPSLDVTEGKLWERMPGAKCKAVRVFGSRSQLHQIRYSRKPGPRSCWELMDQSQKWGLHLLNCSWVPYVEGPFLYPSENFGFADYT